MTLLFSGLREGIALSSSQAPALYADGPRINVWSFQDRQRRIQIPVWNLAESLPANIDSTELDRPKVWLGIKKLPMCIEPCAYPWSRMLLCLQRSCSCPFQDSFFSCLLTRPQNAVFGLSSLKWLICKHLLRCRNHICRVDAVSTVVGDKNVEW